MTKSGGNKELAIVGERSEQEVEIINAFRHDETLDGMSEGDGWDEGRGDGGGIEKDG